MPYLLVKPDRALFFPSVENIMSRLTSSSLPKKDDDLESANEAIEEIPIIMDFSSVCEMDFTAAKVLLLSTALINNSLLNAIISGYTSFIQVFEEIRKNRLFLRCERRY